MGAKHSCCAYSSPRTENRNKKDKIRGRESSRESDRYEPAQINNISQKVSESRGDLQHIRWIADCKKLRTFCHKFIFVSQWAGARWLGRWPKPPPDPHHHVHGEVQAGHHQRHEQEEVPDAPRGISIHRRLYNAQKGVQLFNNIYWRLDSVSAKLEEHDKVCVTSDLLPHQEPA